MQNVVAIVYVNSSVTLCTNASACSHDPKRVSDVGEIVGRLPSLFYSSGSPSGLGGVGSALTSGCSTRVGSSSAGDHSTLIAPGRGGE